MKAGGECPELLRLGREPTGPTRQDRRFCREVSSTQLHVCFLSCVRCCICPEGSFSVGWLLGLEMNKGSRILHSSMKSCRSLNDGFGAVLDDFEALVDRAYFPAVR